MSSIILCSVSAAVCNSSPAPPSSLEDLPLLVTSNTGPNQLVYLLNNQSELPIHQLIEKIPLPLILGNHLSRWNNINADLWFPAAMLNVFVLVLCQELRQCQRLITEHIERHVFNPRRKVFMQLIGEQEGPPTPPGEQLLRDIFHECWRINLLNVVIRFAGIDGRPQKFTYNPFAGEGSFLTNFTDREQKRLHR